MLAARDWASGRPVLRTSRAQVNRKQTRGSHVLVDVAFLEQSPDSHTSCVDRIQLRLGVARKRSILYYLHHLVTALCTQAQKRRLRTQVLPSGVTEALRWLQKPGNTLPRQRDFGLTC